jgi:hypothetical protein
MDRAYIRRVNRESLFRRLIGKAFDDLPASIRAVHAGSSLVLRGHCEVIRGTGLLSRLCAAIASLPPAAERIPISVSVDVEGERVRWRRDFGGHPFQSTLRAVDGMLEESTGPAAFRFRLVPSATGIRWDLVGMRILGLPLPAFARATIHASESAPDGVYAFDARVALPVIGLLVHYRGRLEPAQR